MNEQKLIEEPEPTEDELRTWREHTAWAAVHAVRGQLAMAFVEAALRSGVTEQELYAHEITVDTPTLFDMLRAGNLDPTLDTIAKPLMAQRLTVQLVTEHDERFDLFGPGTRTPEKRIEPSTSPSTELRERIVDLVRDYEARYGPLPPELRDELRARLTPHTHDADRHRETTEGETDPSVAL